MSDVLERAVALADAPRPNIDSKSLDALIRKAKAEQKEMYGFEDKANEALQAHITNLERQKKEPQFAEYRKFSTLDMLKWRDNNGYPRLVLFGLDSPKFTIDVGWDNARRWGGQYAKSYSPCPHLPMGLVQCYDDVIRKFSKRVLSEAPWTPGRIKLSCEYVGVIPSDIRSKIKEAANAFGKDSVFIMAEGTNWAYNEEPKPRLADPLVVGWDGGSLWLVAQFDLTPIERFIASEFTL